MLGTNCTSRFLHRSGAVFAAAGLLAGMARAQSPDGAGNDYCVIHAFRLTTPGNLPPAVFLKHKEHTTARTNTCKDEDKGEGTVPIGVGVTTMTVTSTAPASTADATAKATINVLGVGVVAGSVEANGNATASIAGCPPPAPPRGFGRATAYSSAQVTARGRYEDSRGRIRWSGGWKNSRPVAGSKQRKIVKDPVKGRLIDNTTGITTELVMLSLHSSVSGGESSWEGGMLTNTGTDMKIDLAVGGAFAAQSGTLRVVATGGIVTESVATGMFAGTPIPAVGAGAGFAVPLPDIEFDYDMGADPMHDVVVEIDFDGGGETEDDAAGIGDQDCSSLITDVGTGFDGVNISALQGTDSTFGFHTGVDQYHVADDFEVPLGPPAMLDALRLPIYQVGAPAEFPIIAAYARIWAGEPGGSGVPIAGDMTTNRMVDYRYDALNRLVRSDPHNQQRLIKEVWLDMSWAPPLPPGRYWVEVATRGQTIFSGPWTPSGAWPSPQDNAMGFSVATNTWAPLRDTGSNRPVDLALRLYGPAGQQHEPCYANCDGSSGTPLLTANDFTCFLNNFISGNSYANCDGIGGLTANDFTCFVNAYTNGCP